MKKLVVVSLFLLCPSARAARLTLADAEAHALARSPRLHAAEQQAAAATEGADSVWARLLPRFSLDGSFRYVTVVPSLRIGAATQTLGDNESYSIGPALTYTLFDGGVVRNSWRSLSRLADARHEDLRALRRQLLASTRLAYAQAQIAQQELRLVERSLGLARSQQTDITKRFRAGSASRLDWISAQRETSQYEMRLAAAQAEWRAALVELSSLTGDRDAAPTLDGLEVSVRAVSTAPLQPPGGDHPQLRAQSKRVESLQLSADSQAAARWPQLALQAKTSLDYPNGPTLERIHQSSINLTLTLPLFDWGQIGGAAEQKRAESLAAKFQSEQLATELQRDWAKAESRLRGLREQRASAANAVVQSEEMAKLSYRAYRAGQISLLDVQTTNLRLLEAQVQKARLDGQMLVQFSMLRALGARGQRSAEANDD